MFKNLGYLCYAKKETPAGNLAFGAGVFPF